MSSTDTIIIGGGHNGLICATLLAKAGQKVVLVEAADTLGGLARDREFHPGFKASVAQTLYALPTSVIPTIWKQAIAPPISAGLNRNHPRIYVLPPDPRTDPVQNCLQSNLPIARAFRGARWALFAA